MKSLVVLVCLALSCSRSSTSFESVWGTPSAIHRVVVMYDGQDGATRRTVEDAMTRKLMQHGIRAITSYAVLDDNELEDAALAKLSLAAKGFDSLLEIRFINNGRVETNLYSLHDRELVWSARTKMRRIEDVTTLVAARLERNAATTTARR